MLTEADCKPLPLTQLSEEESLFSSTVRQFAVDTIAPLVRSMDDEQKIAPGLVEKLYELGIMGIEVPEEMGGAAHARVRGGKWFWSLVDRDYGRGLLSSRL